MSQSPNLPFTYLFMLTDYVIIYQQKDQHRRTKIHHLTATGKLISTIKLAKIYHYFTTNKDTTAKSIHHNIILNEQQGFFCFHNLYMQKKERGRKALGLKDVYIFELRIWFLPDYLPFYFFSVTVLNISLIKESFNSEIFSNGVSSFLLVQGYS